MKLNLGEFVKNFAAIQQGLLAGKMQAEQQQYQRGQEAVQNMLRERSFGLQERGFNADEAYRASEQQYRRGRDVTEDERYAATQKRQEGLDLLNPHWPENLLRESKGDWLRGLLANYPQYQGNVGTDLENLYSGKPLPQVKFGGPLAGGAAAQGMFGVTGGVQPYGSPFDPKNLGPSAKELEAERRYRLEMAQQAEILKREDLRQQAITDRAAADRAARERIQELRGKQGMESLVEKARNDEARRASDAVLAATGDLQKANQAADYAWQEFDRRSKGELVPGGVILPPPHPFEPKFRAEMRLKQRKLDDEAKNRFNTLLKQGEQIARTPGLVPTYLDALGKAAVEAGISPAKLPKNILQQIPPGKMLEMVNQWNYRNAMFEMAQRRMAGANAKPIDKEKRLAITSLYNSLSSQLRTLRGVELPLNPDQHQKAIDELQAKIGPLHQELLRIGGMREVKDENDETILVPDEEAAAEVGGAPQAGGQQRGLPPLVTNPAEAQIQMNVEAALAEATSQLANPQMQALRKRQGKPPDRLTAAERREMEARIRRRTGAPR